MHFAPGQAIVRQGDRPDGFYVIKHGRAAVLAGDAAALTSGVGGDGAGEPLTTLGPGEVFGEMALLTDSPRTATVVADTDLTVWRLSRSRFEALLDHERGIARSIERSLSHRLSAMNHETGALRALSHRLTAAALGRLSPAATRLVAGVAARPRWNAEVLRRTCARTGDDGALSELVEQSGLLRAEGVGPGRRLHLPRHRRRERSRAESGLAAGRRRGDGGSRRGRRGHGPRARGGSGRGRREAPRRPRGPPAPDRFGRGPGPLARGRRGAIAGDRGAARRPAHTVERADGGARASSGARQPRARGAALRAARPAAHDLARAQRPRGGRDLRAGVDPARAGGARARRPRRARGDRRDRAAARGRRAARLRRHAVPDAGPGPAGPGPRLGHPRGLRDPRLEHDLHASRHRRRGGPVGPHVPARAAVAPATAAPVHPAEHRPVPDGRRDDRRARQRLHPDRPRGAHRARHSPTPWASRREARARPPSGS